MNKGRICATCGAKYPAGYSMIYEDDRQYMPLGVQMDAYTEGWSGIF